MTQTIFSSPPAPAAGGADQYLRALVDRWDALIDWEGRKAGEGSFFVDVLNGAGARRVLDAAAGTGFHAVTLAEAGFEVTAVDGSANMVARARENAARRHVAVRTAQADWLSLGDTVTERFDAIVCLGSSFPHLFEEAQRVQVLDTFRSLLVPGGVLIVDHRNFDAIRAHRYRSSGKYYYTGRGVRVTVDHIDPRLCRFRYQFRDHSVHHLEVYPILAAELRSLLADRGFSTVETFGDFGKAGALMSADFIIHVARTPGGAAALQPDQEPAS